MTPRSRHTQSAFSTTLYYPRGAARGSLPVDGCGKGGLVAVTDQACCQSAAPSQLKRHGRQRIGMLACLWLHDRMQDYRQSTALQTQVAATNNPRSVLYSRVTGCAGAAFSLPINLLCCCASWSTAADSISCHASRWPDLSVEAFVELDIRADEEGPAAPEGAEGCAPVLVPL